MKLNKLKIVLLFLILQWYLVTAEYAIESGDSNISGEEWIETNDNEDLNSIDFSAITEPSALAEYASDSDPVTKLAAITRAQELLSTQEHDVIDEFVANNWIPIFVEALSSNNLDIQYQAAYSLQFISVGTHIQAIVEAGAIQPLIYLLESKNVNILLPVVWTLGSIVSDQQEYRDICLELDIVKKLINVIKITDKSTKLFSDIIWTMSHLNQYQNSPLPLETICDILPILASNINHSDKSIATNSLRGIENAARDGEERIQLIIGHEMLLRNIIKAVRKSEPIALNILVYITYHDKKCIQNVLDENVLKFLKKPLLSTDTEIKELSLFILQNILCGTEEQIDDVFDAKFGRIFIKYLNSKEHKIQIAAAAVVSNAAFYEKSAQKMITQRVFVRLCILLEKMYYDHDRHYYTFDNIKDILLTLQRLIQNAGNKMDIIIHQIQNTYGSHNGVDMIALFTQESFDDNIQQLANEIVSSLEAAEGDVNTDDIL